jgi:DNA uptake protein ComE-like DNA-binding protein
MTQGELETELTKLGASKPQELAKKIVDNRNKKNGYKNAADLATKLAITESDLPVGLRFTY